MTPKSEAQAAYERYLKAKLAPPAKESKMDFMKIIAGFRTMAVAAVIAALPTVTEVVFAVDPVAVFGLSPTAGAVVGAIFAALRMLTNTTVFKHTSPAPLPPIEPLARRK